MLNVRAGLGRHFDPRRIVDCEAWALRLQPLDSLQAKLQALAVLQSARSVADAACLADNTPGDLQALPLSLKSH